MGLVQHFISPATLPQAPVLNPPLEHLSILSYNVLLPNSVDGWWTYKMYNPPIPEHNSHQSSWEYRRELLKERIQVTNADVVCLQEVSPKSFEEDFDFMNELGYDHELFKKGRFRPVTFYKKWLKLTAPAVHKDRCLLTSFQLSNSSTESDPSPRNWYVLNVHLQAGNQAQRRVRQINEGVRSALTLSRKQKEKEPEETIRLIVCGDFNGGEECGAVEYLQSGFVDETFVEDGKPVTSSRKEIPLKSPLTDVATVLSDKRDPPPTLVVSELISNLIKSGKGVYEGTVEFSQEMDNRLERIYKKLSTNENGMSIKDVEQWLIKINGQLGRGDEYREAARQLGWTDDEVDRNESYEEQKSRIKLPESGCLSLEGFKKVYKKELEAGKFWGIAHDCAILGDPLPDAGIFEARYDRIYYSKALQPTAVLDTVSSVSCPNEKEPSDHLPVAAAFQSE